ncbi:hypothetical protein DRN73_06350 [Candidatus Pacearchaeota archaeon]|nr:MAG: hypothetical protein DRN73_06350 [Candidatus Pacearchaeota archaeon]
MKILKIFLYFIVGVFLFKFAEGCLEFYTLYKEKNKLEKKIEKLQIKKIILENDYRYYTSKEGIEEQLYYRFGIIKE